MHYTPRPSGQQHRGESELPLLLHVDNSPSEHNSSVNRVSTERRESGKKSEFKHVCDDKIKLMLPKTSN